ncbi:MAG: GTP-binding protein [Hyphomicrobiaceae bacterium]|nr:GTP-binding protein [Hyphomicrobiaceae bacterium]
MDLPIPLTVLTGYLGSGKTTLLKALLTRPEMAGTAVIVNEFGEVGLDDALIETAEGDAVLLPSGCVCCAVRGDLVRALLGLHEDVMRGAIPDLRRVVLETTGLADPAPISQTLIEDRDLFRIYRLDGIVATVDAQHGLDQLDTTYETARQIAVADRIVLTKSDLVEAHAVDRVAARVRALNPGAPMRTAVKGAIDASQLLDLHAYEIRGEADADRWLAAERYAAHDATCSSEDCDHPHHNHGHRHLHGIRSFCLTFDAPLEAAKLELAIELLRAAHGGSLLRVKGLLNVVEHEQPFVIHGVQHVFYPVETLERWPSDDRRTRIVFITRDLEEAAVRAHFAPLMNAAGAA